MSMVEHLGRSPATGLEVYWLAIPSPEALPDSLSLFSAKFTCFLAWDAAEDSSAVTSAMMRKLLRLGCVYLSCWGQGCERRHDIMDEVLIGEGNAEWQDHGIATTWHAEDSLAEALDFFLDLASPAECNQEQCGSALALVVGGDPNLVLDRLRLQL